MMYGSSVRWMAVRKSASLFSKCQKMRAFETCASLATWESEVLAYPWFENSRIAVSRIFSRVSIRDAIVRRSLGGPRGLRLSNPAPRPLLLAAVPEHNRRPVAMKTSDDGEKDKLGDTLHQKKKAEEDRYFAEREAAALRRLRQATGNDGRCSRCGQPFAPTADGTPATTCPSGHPREDPPAPR